MAFNEREKLEHPSFGMLSIHRCCGHSGYLFGSNAEPNNYISIELNTAHMERELSNDWYYADKPIVRVKLSPVQFSELLTTQNGCGVPVTIEILNGERVEQKEFVEDKRTATERQFRERMASFVSGIKERSNTANAIIGKKTLSKNDQQELRGIFSSIVQELELNMPFFITVFGEEMEKVVTDAKAEINAAITHSIIEAGVKALGIDFNSGRVGIENKK